MSKQNDKINTKFMKKNNVLIGKEELIQAVLSGHMTKAELAKRVGITRSAVTQFFKRLEESQGNPVIKKIKKENREFLERISENLEDIPDLEPFEHILKRLIFELQAIINDTRPELIGEWTPGWNNTRIKAMSELKDTMKMFIEYYGDMKSNRDLTQLQIIKDKLDLTVDFLVEKSPELVSEYIDFISSE